MVMGSGRSSLRTGLGESRRLAKFSALRVLALWAHCRLNGRDWLRARVAPPDARFVGTRLFPEGKTLALKFQQDLFNRKSYRLLNGGAQRLTGLVACPHDPH